MRQAPLRLVVVSNRGPYQLHTTRRGLKREKTIGGLVTSILPMLEKLGGTWIAWGEPAGRHTPSPRRASFRLRYISLTPDQVQKYYFGLANNALWPLCHYFLGRVKYDNSQWQAYAQVNQQFAQAALEESAEEDLVWFQDYHLALAPSYLRRERPNARIASFWHIPFPPAEVFRTLPWRQEFLEGLLASDLIGFHLPEYVENFVETAGEVLGLPVEGEFVRSAGRQTRVLARPIGIDYQAVNLEARTPRVDARVRQLRETLGRQTLILGVERLDYTKGILERLLAMERLLEREPSLHGKVCLLQIVTPSRARLDAYNQKKREIDEVVGRINGRFSDGLWQPIRYLVRAVSPRELIVYYRAAEIALVTPLRDGLNLVAKEYVASRVESDGVLILSEFAGAAYQLPEALLVNPYSTEEMVEALLRAMRMPPEEQRSRMEAMQERIMAQDIAWWSQEFLDRMIEIAAGREIARVTP